jgi:hypothetical protein
MTEEEVDIGELEYDYEQQILMDFTKLINNFQSEKGMENISLIRLLNDIENKLLNEIEIN